VGRDPVTAQRRYVTATVRGRKRHAQRELVSLLHSAHDGALSRSSSTVADLLEAPRHSMSTRTSLPTLIEKRHGTSAAFSRPL